MRKKSLGTAAKGFAKIFGRELEKVSAEMRRDGGHDKSVVVAPSTHMTGDKRAQ